MPTPPPHLTTTEHAVLGAVAMLGEASGYDVAAYVRRSIGLIWSPARSHIYRVLPRLERLGLARAEASVRWAQAAAARLADAARPEASR